MTIYIIVYNKTHDEGECALYDATNDVVIIRGDYYHNKIDSQIEGFFTALQYTKQPFEKGEIDLTPELNISLWNKCSFYDGRED